MKINTKYSVLTPTGYQSFDGIRKLQNCVYKITTNKNYIQATEDHPFVIDGKIILTKQLKVGDTLQSRNEYLSVVSIVREDCVDVFDLINVSGGNIYYANDILVHNCFLRSGESAVSDVLYEDFKKEIREPQFIYEDGAYRIWEKPREGRLYVAGGDVAEGIGEDATCMQILDITDLKNIEQVAVYRNKSINPLQFTAKCYEILQHWGSPPACIERNNCGGQVVDGLRQTHNYENIISYGPKAGAASYDRLGILAHTNSKYKGVMNMRYYVNEVQAVRLHDRDTLNELRTFIRYPNGTWSAMAGSDIHDDSVMALIWGLIILETEIAEKYYEIVDYDDNRKPLKLKSLEYISRSVIDPTQYMTDLRESGDNTMPMFLPGYDNEPDDGMRKLEMDGWKLLNS